MVFFLRLKHAFDLRRCSALSIILLSIISFSSTAAPSLWQVSNGDQQWTLFGSIHLGKPSFYPLPARYYQALDQADRLIVELDTKDITPQQMQQMRIQTSLPEGSTLEQQLSPQQWRSLHVLLQDLNYPEQYAQPLKPWFLSMQLSQIKMQQMGFSGEQGVDQHFLGHAKQLGLSVHSLESFEQQLAVLSQLETIQVPLLEQTVADFDLLPALINEMVHHWQQGQNKELYALLLKDPMFQQSPDIIDALLFKRNKAWLKHLQTLSGNSFVVVGALHLYGEHGLLALFKRQGYSIHQMDIGLE